VEILRVSACYLTPPLGPPGQPWYANAAVQVKTRLTPEELMRVLIGMERAMGRVRGQRWGPRLIDLDLLLYNGEVVDGPDLTLPHPEMHRRAFVLVPLAEIAPDAWHPVFRKTARELLEELEASEREAVQKI
jgi:2-amino-4-hydroxy-6-hydroxymethyldihydropteridine diphosphokinase